MGIFNKKPIPYEVYPIEQAMKFMKKYGAIYDFPAHGDGHMAVPKEKIIGNHIQSQVIINQKQQFRNDISRQGKLRGINVQKGYDKYQNTKKSDGFRDITR